MSWYLFAFTTPLLYTFTNFIEKFLIDKRVKNPLILIVIAGFVSLVFSLFLFTLRGIPQMGLKEIGIIIFAGILLKLYLIPYLHALKLEDASRVVPIFQIIPVIVLSLAWILLDESMTIPQLLGAIVVISGGMILGSEKIDRKTFKLRKAFWLMILSSFMYATILVLFRALVINHSMWDLLTFEYLGAAIAGIGLLLNKQIKASFTQEFVAVKSISKYLVLNESLVVGAQVAEAAAISLVPVAFVSIIGSTQPVMLLIIGLILSTWFSHIVKEDVSKKTILQKLVSIGIIFSGLYLVYFY